jgi:hypothetical protein
MLKNCKSLTPLLGAAAVGLVAAMLIAVGSRQAAATPKFAQMTTRQCEFCHSKPSVLNDRGKNFARTLPIWER